MKKTNKNTFLAIIGIIAVIFPLATNARSGCCSHHGGVCGCGCCDGTSLSATCAPYYPRCNRAYVVPTTTTPPATTTTLKIIVTTTTVPATTTSTTQIIQKLKPISKPTKLQATTTQIPVTTTSSTAIITTTKPITSTKPITTNKDGFMGWWNRIWHKN